MVWFVYVRERQLWLGSLGVPKAHALPSHLVCSRLWEAGREEQMLSLPRCMLACGMSLSNVWEVVVCAETWGPCSQRQQTRRRRHNGMGRMFI